MRTIIIAAALVAACTDPNDDRAADCAPDVPECNGDCILVTGFDDEGRVRERVWTTPEGRQVAVAYWPDGVPMRTTYSFIRSAVGPVTQVEQWCWPSGTFAAIIDAGQPVVCFLESGESYPCVSPPREVVDEWGAGFSSTSTDERI